MADPKAWITNPNVQQAMNFFQRNGWSPPQAAGIVANLWNEGLSNENDHSGDDGRAYGIAQWHPDRQQAFADWMGKPIAGSSLIDQLGFVQHELTAGADAQSRKAGTALKDTGNPADAAGIVMRGFERPADPMGYKAFQRGVMAEDLHKAWNPPGQNGLHPSAQQIQPRLPAPSLSPQTYSMPQAST
jgi:hypothetical protein